nr:MAG TPA: hypothetical protein [Caudoviricetes sp.]
MNIKEYSIINQPEDGILKKTMKLRFKEIMKKELL